MILAAGRGERMKTLTRNIPKPLLEAGGKPLIEHHILKLAQAGIQQLVINHGPQGERIEQTLGTGARYGVHIHYSPEGDTPLETAGGIVQALRTGQLGDEPFLLVNADVYTDLDFSRLQLPGDALGHLVLVDNPPHHPQGDFGLRAGRLCLESAPRRTYSGIGIYRPQAFADIPPGVRPLRPVLEALIGRQGLSGEYFQGLWIDVGTQERLDQANNVKTVEDAPGWKPA